MSATDPATHRFGQTSIGNYEADFAKMKEDLADMLKDKLGLLWVGIGCIVGHMLMLLI